MPIRFSASTIKAGFLCEEPDWYKVKFTKHFTKAASTGSTNHFLVAEVAGANKGEATEKMIGVPVTKLINEKADWIALPIIKAALNGEDPDPEKDYELKDLVDVEMEAYIKRGQQQDGTPMNDMIDFAPLGTNLKE